jgi:hypothetical protein
MENCSIFKHYEKLTPMSGEEIAQVPMWGSESQFKRIYAKPNSDNYVIDFEGSKTTTRQHVSSILKKGMGKVYTFLKNDDPEASPFDIAVNMLVMFGVNHSNKKEIKKFFRLFPKKIKNEIEKDGREKLALLCGEAAM